MARGLGRPLWVLDVGGLVAPNLRMRRAQHDQDPLSTACAEAQALDDLLHFTKSVATRLWRRYPGRPDRPRALVVAQGDMSRLAIRLAAASPTYVHVAVPSPAPPT